MRRGRILVTGASGFVGRHCLARLAALGFEVVGVSRAVAGSHTSGIRWISADLLAPLAAEQLVEVVRPTHLLHLAWYAKAPDYWHSELNTEWARRSVALVRAFIAAGGRHVVAAGTCAEYAWLGDVCDEVRTPLRPATPYGEMKHRTHTELADIARSQDVPFAWGRLFFVYGPGEESAKLFSSSLQRIRAGDVVSLKQPLRRLDFVHVEDVAQAFVSLIDVTADGTYNIATGSGTAIRDAIVTLARAAGCDARIESSTASREPDVVADVTRLRSAIHWQPRDVAVGASSLI